MNCITVVIIIIMIFQTGSGQTRELVTMSDRGCLFQRYFYVYFYVCMYIYIYIYVYVCMYMCVYIYIYICMNRQRDHGMVASSLVERKATAYKSQHTCKTTQL